MRKDSNQNLQFFDAPLLLKLHTFSLFCQSKLLLSFELILFLLGPAFVPGLGGVDGGVRGLP